MTGARELVQVRGIPAAPEQIRLSVIAAGTQLDISLPLDAPIAALLPELVKLARSRDGRPAPVPEDSTAKDAQRNFWTLRTADGAQDLPADSTLREAGVGNGSLLRLTAQRALSAPTLYDDVVDAAARLNKAAYAGWDATAARGMAFAGIHLSALALLYFLVGQQFSAHRPALVGISAVVAATLTAIAALAHRSYAQSTLAAAVGWAAIPISAGVVWAVVHGLGGYGLAAGCAALAASMCGMYRAVGTGRWGYLATGISVVLGGAAVAAHQGGVRADLVGAGLAVISTLACLTVPWLTAPMARFKGPRTEVEPEPEASMFDNPFDGAVTPTRNESDAAVPHTPTAERVWERVRTAQLTRSALYTGFAASAAVGAAVVLGAQSPPTWSGLVLGLTCAAALCLYVRRATGTLERASLVLPAVVLGAGVCWVAQDGGRPLALVAFSVLLVTAVGAAVAGMTMPDGHVSQRITTSLRYLDYLASAALLPLALWVAGVYSRLGF